VIVGGMSKLPGIADFAKEKLQLASRVGRLQPVGGLIDTVADPTYATAVGLMLLDMLLLPGSNQSQSRSESTGNVFGVVEGMWRKFKRK
jgi:cell division protein FtsA